LHVVAGDAAAEACVQLDALHVSAAEAIGTETRWSVQPFQRSPPFTFVSVMAPPFLREIVTS
jgi:hypothetical protein